VTWLLPGLLIIDLIAGAVFAPIARCPRCHVMARLNFTDLNVVVSIPSGGNPKCELCLDWQRMSLMKRYLLTRKDLRTWIAWEQQLDR
jgi:hypothetical protein